MAEEQQDDSSKTEEPTPRRLEDARKKGEMPISKEISNWFMMMGIAIVVMLALPWIGNRLSEALKPFLERPEDFLPGEAGFHDLGWTTVKLFLSTLIIPFIVFIAAALLSQIVQNGLVFTSEPIAFKWDRVSMISGMKKLFSMTSVVEFAKAFIKMIIVSSVAVALMVPVMNGIDLTISFAPDAFMEKTHRIAVRLIIGVLAVLSVIAILDWLYQRQSFLKKMRMSKYELKEEFKQSEGDPHIKRKLAEIRNERARKRMMAAVPSATVVVTNPTHYAVALKYEKDKSSAPILVAKGKDDVAARIREVAEEHNIPILRNPPVARSLYRDVEVDEEVPNEYYEIVAKIIGYVLRLKGILPGAPGLPPTAPPDDEDL